MSPFLRFIFCRIFGTRSDGSGTSKVVEKGRCDVEKPFGVTIFSLRRFGFLSADATFAKCIGWPR